MDKYPLIGVSIIAVVLLVLSSLTNVIGYQTVKSTIVNESPLFNIRIKRAINNERGSQISFFQICILTQMGCAFSVKMLSVILQ